MGQGISHIHVEVREKSGDFIYVIMCVKSLNRKTGWNEIHISKYPIKAELADFFHPVEETGLNPV